MKPLRPLQLLTAVLLGSVLYSCATPPPPVRIAPPENLVGLFSGRDGGGEYGVVMDIRFFPEGTVHIHSLWEDDGNSYSETGTYKYSPASGKLEIGFDPEVSFAEISSYVSGNPAAFITKGIKLVQQDTRVLPAGIISRKSFTGAWVMYYQYEGELVEVTLDLNSSGSFVETTRYFEADDDLVEMGRFEIDGRTGLISFYYAANPDYAYIAYYDTHLEALYTYDGDFHRKE